MCCSVGCVSIGDGIGSRSVGVGSIISEVGITPGPMFLKYITKRMSFNTVGLIHMLNKALAIHFFTYVLAAVMHNILVGEFPITIYHQVFIDLYTKHYHI